MDLPAGQTYLKTNTIHDRGSPAEFSPSQQRYLQSPLAPAEARCTPANTAYCSPVNNAPQNTEVNRMYQAPAQMYQAPARMYQAPAQMYQAPAQMYQAPARMYQAPAQMYQAPAQMYQAPAQMYQAPAQMYQAPRAEIYEFPRTEKSRKRFVLKKERAGCCSCWNRCCCGACDPDGKCAGCNIKGCCGREKKVLRKQSSFTAIMRRIEGEMPKRKGVC